MINIDLLKPFKPLGKDPIHLIIFKELVNVIKSLWQVWKQVDLIHVLDIFSEWRKWPASAQTFLVSFHCYRLALAPWWINDLRGFGIELKIWFDEGLGLHLSGLASWSPLPRVPSLLDVWRSIVLGGDICLFRTPLLNILKLCHKVLSHEIFQIVVRFRPNEIHLRNFGLLAIIKTAAFVFIRFLDTPNRSIGRILGHHHGITVLFLILEELNVPLIRPLLVGLPVRLRTVEFLESSWAPSRALSLLHGASPGALELLGILQGILPGRVTYSFLWVEKRFSTSLRIQLQSLILVQLSVRGWFLHGEHIFKLLVANWRWPIGIIIEIIKPGHLNVD